MDGFTDQACQVHEIWMAVVIHHHGNGAIGHSGHEDGNLGFGVVGGSRDGATLEEGGIGERAEAEGGGSFEERHGGGGEGSLCVVFNRR